MAYLPDIWENAILEMVIKNFDNEKDIGVAMSDKKLARDDTR